MHPSCDDGAFHTTSNRGGGGPAGSDATEAARLADVDADASNTAPKQLAMQMMMMYLKVLDFD